jgi:hypothetical protein
MLVRVAGINVMQSKAHACIVVPVACVAAITFVTKAEGVMGRLENMVSRAISVSKPQVMLHLKNGEKVQKWT